MNTLRNAIRRHRILVLAFIIVVVVPIVDGLRSVEAQERGFQMAGEGESTVAPSVAGRRAAITDRELSGPVGDRLPFRNVSRKARTREAGALSGVAAERSSAIAPPPRVLQRNGITPSAEIDAFATSLGDSPAAIFAHVHDNVDFDPKWGADSPPVGTLWEGRGTAWDQAWLLQHLLVAAGVDARLEWGEVEIEPSLLLAITGVDDPVRAGDMLTTAGLPVVLILDGSQVVAARMPHVWVKAHLDYIPDRGARPGGTPDTWVRLDPSLKTFDRLDGQRIDDDVFFVLADYLLAGTEISPRADYEADLQAFLTGLGLGGLDDVKPLRDIRGEDFPFVPGTLRAKIVSVSGESEAFPDAYHVRLGLEVREEGGAQLAIWTTPLASVYGGLFELRWPGATAADQATLDLYGGVFATPPYEVDLRPSLVLDGVEVATGSAIGSAEDAEIVATVTPPAGLDIGNGVPILASWELFVGEPSALIFDLGSTPQPVVDGYAQTAAALTDPDDVLVASLATAGAIFLRDQADDLDHLAALEWYRPINLGTAVLAVKRGAVSTTSDGTPETFSAGPLSLVVGARTLGLFPVDGVQTSTVPALEVIGAQGSVREGEALTTVFGGEHVTAVGFLTRAVREGQTLTRVDDTNVDAALAAAELGIDAEVAIAFGVSQGAIAWIPENQIEINSFDTTGYILEDPVTGAGGYFVSFERRYLPLVGAVVFHTPADLDAITAPVDVVASIEIENIETWSLSSRPVGETGTTPIASGTGAVDNRLLGQFDPTLLRNGSYELVLTGQDSAGQSVTGLITVTVEGGLKIGNFTLPFLDLQLSVLGIDIDVIRTYDSRDRRVGDFGHGWRLSLSDVQLRENVPPGLRWQGTRTGGPLPSYCIVPTRPHLVTVVLPGDEVYRFQPTPTPQCSPIVPPQVIDFEYRPLGRTRGSLRPIDQNLRANVVGSFPGPIELWDQQTVQPHDGATYELVTDDGRIFIIHDQDGLRSITDRNGNVLSVSSTGINHSAGIDLDIVRDGAGRIETITDPEGNQMIYDYDLAGDLVSVIDTAGDETRFSYVDDHYLDTIFLPSGEEILAAEYDGDGRLLSTCRNGACFDRSSEDGAEVWTDATGRETTMAYNDRGDIIALTESYLGESRTYNFEYNDFGQVTRQVDPDGGETLVSYDGRGNRESITTPFPVGADAADYTTTMTYEDNRVTSVTFPGGLTLTADYDDRGNLLEIRQGDRLVEKRTYRADGALLSEEDAFGVFAYSDIDAMGRPGEITDPRGVVLSGDYDANGRATELSVDGGPPSTFSYDGRGRQLTAQYANGASATYSYGGTDQWETFDSSGTGVIRRVEDVNDRLRGLEVRGRTDTLYSYDLSGRVRLAEGPLDRDTTYEYDPFGAVAKIIAPNTGETEFERDSMGRVLEITDALDHVTSFTYKRGGSPETFTDARDNTWTFDQTPNASAVTDPLSRTTTTYLDAYGSPVRTVFADTTERRLEYLEDVPLGEEGSFVSKVIDELGRERSYGYDELGDLVSATDLAGEVYTFIASGSESTITAPNGETVVFDADDSFYSFRFGDGGVTRFDLAADRQPTKKTLPSGATLDYGYDAFRRRDTVTDSATGEVHTFGWNDANEMTSTTDVGGTTTLDYDKLGDLTSKEMPDGSRVVYHRDVLGQVEQVELWPPGAAAAVRVIDYVYDASGNLTRVVDPVAGTTVYDYHPDIDRLERRTLPNGVITDYGYDARDRVTSMVHRAADGTVIASYDYVRDLTGEPTRITREDGSYTILGYDGALRLERETRYAADGTQIDEVAYTYDTAGNRMTVDDGSEVAAYAYDAGFQISAVTRPSGNDESYAFDADGQLETMVRDGVTTTLDHSTAGQLLAVTRSAATVSYRYDALGNRVAATDPGGGRRFIVAPTPQGVLEQPHMVTDDSGALVSGYVHAGADPLMRFDAAGEVFYLTDAMGTVIGLTDGSGAVVARFDYDSFGTLRSATGTAVSGPAGSGGDFRFHGAWLEEQTGLYHMGARDYDPATGRFLSRDPLGPRFNEPESTNPYLFANANPRLFSDPTGLFSIVSVNITMSVQNIVGTIRTVALNQIREEIRERLLEAVGKIVLNAMAAYLPVDFADVAKKVLELADEVGEDAPFWRRVELGIQRGLCWLTNDSAWVNFEPRIDRFSGKIDDDGFGCPAEEGKSAGRPAGTAFPDFYISQNSPKSNSGGVLLGEIKSSIRTFYYTWIKRRASGKFYRPEQFEAFTKHTRKFVPARLMALVAFNDGSDLMKASLAGEMVTEGVAGFIIVLK
ncbi:MAG: RHS repeat-associated core domain-containing protein [Acidobacteriota bacterium]